MTAPTLTTDRLVLRGHAAADFDACFGLWNEPEIKRVLGDANSSRQAVWNRLVRYAGLWTILGYGYWAVTDRETGDYLGEAGLADFKRDMEPPLGPTPESGWSLIARARGRGLATEAMQAVLAWSDDALGQETCCIIDPENRPSVRVAEKLGYRRRSSGRLGEKDLQVYRRPSRV